MSFGLCRRETIPFLADMAANPPQLLAGSWLALAVRLLPIGSRRLLTGMQMLGLMTRMFIGLTRMFSDQTMAMNIMNFTFTHELHLHTHANTHLQLHLSRFGSRSVPLTSYTDPNPRSPHCKESLWGAITVPWVGLGRSQVCWMTDVSASLIFLAHFYDQSLSRYKFAKIRKHTNWPQSDIELLTVKGIL